MFANLSFASTNGDLFADSIDCLEQPKLAWPELILINRSFNFGGFIFDSCD
jgi:hypothetical protein